MVYGFFAYKHYSSFEIGYYTSILYHLQSSLPDLGKFSDMSVEKVAPRRVKCLNSYRGFYSGPIMGFDRSKFSKV